MKVEEEVSRKKQDTCAEYMQKACILRDKGRIICLIRNRIWIKNKVNIKDLLDSFIFQIRNSSDGFELEAFTHYNVEYVPKSMGYTNSEFPGDL